MKVLELSRKYVLSRQLFLKEADTDLLVNNKDVHALKCRNTSEKRRNNSDIVRDYCESGTTQSEYHSN